MVFGMLNGDRSITQDLLTLIKVVFITDIIAQIFVVLQRN